MDIVKLVDRVREHYVEQLDAFAENQARNCTCGSPEVKLQLSDDSNLFEHLYCVDFIKNDGESKVIEMYPDKVLSFDTVFGTYGSAELTIEHLHWDDLLIYHDAANLPAAALKEWFRVWFDLADERRDPAARLSNVIHSLCVEPGKLSVDLGSAPASAFWNMLSLLERAGATAIRVSRSRAEYPAGA